MKKRIVAASIALVAAITTIGFQAATAGKDYDNSAKANKSIYDTAKKAGFSTLLAAVDAADLKETLKKDGPFTVFAPTDEAFAKLPEGALEGLLADKTALKNVLLYHVVSGEVKAADVVGMDSAEMLNGSTAPINTKDGVTIAGANVVKTDIIAKNGVIHVIDTVMLPPSE